MCKNETKTTNNDERYAVVDTENNELLFYISEDEMFDVVAKRNLNKYLGAFKELAE